MIRDSKQALLPPHGTKRRHWLRDEEVFEKDLERLKHSRLELSHAEGDKSALTPVDQQAAAKPIAITNQQHSELSAAGLRSLIPGIPDSADARSSWLRAARNQPVTLQHGAVSVAKDLAREATGRLAAPALENNGAPTPDRVKTGLWH